MIDEKTIRIWWDVFKKDHPLTEVRILGQGKTYSGYFTDPDVMLSQLRNYDGLGIYATINEVKESCYGRAQHDVIAQKPKSTTNDSDIERRRWILLDFDPERPSDTNASDAEIKYAEMKMRQVYKFLRDEGFNAPVVAFSGNGYHLYYSVSIANYAETTEKVKSFLNALDMLFSDEKVKIDTSVFNASRIAKIIGTTSNKGANTAERPQRLSRFIHIPDRVEETDFGFVEKIADMLPKVEQPSRYNGYSNERFDIEGFIRDHGIQIAKRTRFGGGEKLVLAECPFDPNHKAPDAAIFVMDSGAIGFRCLHNSCQHYTWHDVRLHYDPNAYDKKEYQAYQEKRRYEGPTKRESSPASPEDSRGPKWKYAYQTRKLDLTKVEYVPTGISKLDSKIMGFMAGQVTIVSGGSGSGKTSILNHFILNAVKRGNRVGVWSGELEEGQFMSWLYQTIAGNGYIEEIKTRDGVVYQADPRYYDAMDKWLGDKFLLYNNDYGQRWTQLFADIKDCVEVKGANLIFIDNLMAINLDSYDGEKNDRQTSLMNDVKNLAKRTGIHVVLVCHPRKEPGMKLFRKDSISGTADLTNMCDNLLLLHRGGLDFEKRGAEFFGTARMEELQGYNLVVEIAKNRFFGVVDELIGLYYDFKSRRIKNTMYENVIYEWNTGIEPNQKFDDVPDEIWYNNQ